MVVEIDGQIDGEMEQRGLRTMNELQQGRERSVSKVAKREPQTKLQEEVQMMSQARCNQSCKMSERTKLQSKLE